jgi:hypothetical protein
VHYFGVVPAVIQATRNLTPVRLRLWSFAVICTAVALLAAICLVMFRVQAQVRIIGSVAAPQAATAADLYFALSDMDAQVARIVLVDDAEALSGSRIDALGTYRERSRQVNDGLRRSLTTATGAAERSLALTLLDDLAVYRQWVWQALTAGSLAPPQPTGKLAPDALGYYTQATNVLHRDLLPTAQRLRDVSEDRLDRAYADKRITEVGGLALAVLLGGSLLVLLGVLQVWLARRFRRMVNPALVLATLLAFGLVLSAGLVLGTQAARLDAARDDAFTPYLELSRARAVSYDAAADTSRYLISANLPFYKEDFGRKSASLAAFADHPEVRERWQAYARDHERIVALADAGRAPAAIDALTGIRRGDAAFDFFYFDAAAAAATDSRKQAFEAALRDGERLLAGWVVIPALALGLVIALVPLGVRKRLAEYR